MTVSSVNSICKKGLLLPKQTKIEVGGEGKTLSQGQICRWSTSKRIGIYRRCDRMPRTLQPLHLPLGPTFERRGGVCCMHIAPKSGALGVDSPMNHINSHSRVQAREQTEQGTTLQVS